jgi:hypothetical protein
MTGRIAWEIGTSSPPTGGEEEGEGETQMSHPHPYPLPLAGEGDTLFTWDFEVNDAKMGNGD